MTSQTWTTQHIICEQCLIVDSVTTPIGEPGALFDPCPACGKPMIIYKRPDLFQTSDE